MQGRIVQVSFLLASILPACDAAEAQVELEVVERASTSEPAEGDVDRGEEVARVAVNGGEVVFYDTGLGVAVLEVVEKDASSEVRPLVAAGLSGTEVYDAIGGEDPAAVARLGEYDDITAPGDPANGSFSCVGSTCDIAAHVSGCNAWSGSFWTSWIENTRYPGYDEYRHWTNRKTGGTFASAAATSFIGTICPVAIHDFADDGIGMKYQRKSGGSSWTTLFTTPRVGTMIRMVVYEFNAPVGYHFRIKSQGMDSGVLCGSDISPTTPAWICSPDPNDSDEFHASIVWND